MADTSSPEDDFESTYKILVLGDSGVGKTCLIFRFTEGIFSDSYISTIGIDCRSKVVDLDGKKVRLQIWDTAGQERFRTLTNAYYRGAMIHILGFEKMFNKNIGNFTNGKAVGKVIRSVSIDSMGIVLVYDITTEESFKHITQWLQNIGENASPDVCKVLVGNKLDAEDERIIDTHRGQTWSGNANLEFFEASARTGENVSEAFIAVARQIKHRREQKEMRLKYNEGFNPIIAEAEREEQKSCCGAS